MNNLRKAVADKIVWPQTKWWGRLEIERNKRAASLVGGRRNLQNKKTSDDKTSDGSPTTLKNQRRSRHEWHRKLGTFEALV